MKIAVLSVVAVAALAGQAMAGTAFLNVNPNQLTNATSSVMNSRYRISNTNWDQMIASSSNITPSTIVQQANIGNHNALNGVLWDFAVSFNPASGYTFSLSRPNQTSTVSWTAPHTTNGNASPTQAFNTIRMTVDAGSLPNNVSAMSLQVSNLGFVGAGLTNSGTLNNMLDQTPPTQAAVSQLIHAPGLSNTTWSLTGKVQASFTVINPAAAIGNFDERLRFDVRTFSATLIPLPTGAAMGLAGLAVLGFRRRRSA
jgi:hypothetical protein